ncbi:MAG: succinate--CoA ligase subunit alpha [candidate division Zixibacteria bacterium]|nr:succinate--CoA ligase subunit alpha [candidate division Zixibacteria bacterium]
MAIFIDKKTRLVVQGITGRDGAFHAQQMKKYGTNVVAGVTPGKAGAKVDGIPVFNSVADAVKATGANTSVIYVPPVFAIDSIYEAADAGIDTIVCITEGLPANDMMKVYHYLKAKGVRLIGPNSPGLISPGLSKVGIIPGTICTPGPIGVVSRSGTLTYEVIFALTSAGLGQSTCIGIGGDQVIGTNFIDVLTAFEADKATKAVVMIGEIGGADEEEAAAFVAKKMSKPVVAFIAGRTAPPGKRMGHAGAIISGSSGTAADKVTALNAVGIPVATSPLDIPGLVTERLKTFRAGAKKAGAKKGKAPKKAVKPAAAKKKPAAKKARGKR